MENFICNINNNHILNINVKRLLLLYINTSRLI